MSESIDIQSPADFFRWLDSGRQLGIETLVKAGFTEEQIENLLKYGPPGLGTTVGGKGFKNPIVVDAALQAAFKILLLVPTITEHVAEQETPRYRLILDGVLLNDYRREIYESVWFQQDLNKKQRENATKPRTLTAALADKLRQWPDWSERLPVRVGAQETIGHLRVTFQLDGRYLIEDTQTGKKSSAKPDSIAKKIRT